MFFKSTHRGFSSEGPCIFDKEWYTIHVSPQHDTGRIFERMEHMKGNSPTLTSRIPLAADSHFSESHLPIENTDTDSQANGKKLPPTIFIIFGANGDLTKRKLIPALYNLASNQHLSDEFAVIGVDCVPMSTEDFRTKINQDIHELSARPIESTICDWLIQRLHYISGDFQDSHTYETLKECLNQVDASYGLDSTYLYYMATSPTFFPEIVQYLAGKGLVTQNKGCSRRVIFEKPFGHDLQSAQALNRELCTVLAEDQIYRIDHYLGKETVQNILVFRFANGIFEPVWNRRYIDHVQITVAETLGVEHRGSYYEKAGALRDMVTNHLLQLMAFVAMEPPNAFDAEAVRDEKTKVLRAILPMKSDEITRSTVAGQYGPGTIRSHPVLAYRSEPHVARDSHTETFAAMKLFIESWRWGGVPFYLRTGKRLPRRVTEIVIQFKSAPLMLFRNTPVHQLTPNQLIIRIQPDEGISLNFGAKIPGPTVQVGTVDMDFQYAKYFGDTPRTGYETLLHDCMAGDATLFQRSDDVEVGWSVVDPILEVWRGLGPNSTIQYEAGSWGPHEAAMLLEQDGRKWRNPS